MGGILKIDRSKVFNRIKLTMDGLEDIHKDLFLDCSLLENPKEQLLGLSKLNMDSICLESGLGKDELGIFPDQRMKRLEKDGFLLLDYEVLKVVLNNKDLIPEKWKKNGIGAILFEGSVFGYYVYNSAGRVCGYNKFVFGLANFGGDMELGTFSLRKQWQWEPGGYYHLSACLRY